MTNEFNFTPTLIITTLIISDVNRLKKELVKSPTNDVNAATKTGNLNNVGPLHWFSGVDNVKSYITSDGGIMNVTEANHAVRWGFVSRKIVSNNRGGYQIMTYGEGNSWKQVVPGAENKAKSFWTKNANFIKQRAGCN